MTLDVVPLTPAIGAEISNVVLADLKSGGSELAEVRQALVDHHVLVFRDQAIDRQQHKKFGRLFGELHVHPSKRGPDAKGDPEVFSVKADDTSVRNNGGRWHSDVSCDATPPMGSILRLKAAPPQGGDTLFANMHLAFETLSEPIRDMLSGLTAYHDGLQDLRWYGYEPQQGFSYPATSHPVVVTHPVTRRPLLFVNPAFTSRIEGLSDLESTSLLTMLFDHVAQTPTLHCRVRWEPGTLVFWDNQCTQHFAVWDYFPHLRHGERVTIAGTERPQPVL